MVIHTGIIVLMYYI